MKKEIEKINQQIKDNIKAVETKISNQEKSGTKYLMFHKKLPLLPSLRTFNELGLNAV